VIRNLEQRLDQFVALVKWKYPGYLVFGGYFLDKFAAYLKAHLNGASAHIEAIVADGAGYDAAVDALIFWAKKSVQVGFPLSLVASYAFDALGKWLKDHRQELGQTLIDMHGPAEHV
jgi:hypothetical protein